MALDGGALQSATAVQLLAGSNAAAVRNDDGEWEVLQFETALLIAEKTYEISGLLRGQAGTEYTMRASVAAGAPFVLLDGAIARIDLTPDEIRCRTRGATGRGAAELEMRRSANRATLSRGSV